MIYAALTFHPNQKNPARASGRGVWRVKHCWPAAFAFRPAVSPDRVGGLLWLAVDRLYKPGSRVDPKALALRGLRAELKAAA